MRAALEARVRAVNSANSYAMELFPKLRAAIAPFLGEKVVKADGELVKKLKAALPEFARSDGGGLMVYWHRSGYSLAWTVKACETYPTGRGDDHIATYYETTVYVGDLQNGVLVSLADKGPQLRTDYTADDIEAKRQKYRDAKKAADDARSALHPFDEYDR